MVRTVRLGGTASNIEIAGVSHGLMRMSWVPTPVPDEQAFEAIIAGIDAANGAKVCLNTGDFYGYNPPTANLELLARFYEKYPEYVDKTILCVKGGLKTDGTFGLLNTEEEIRYSVDNVNAKLRGLKRVDIYECSRVSPQVPIETIIAILKKLIEEGKFEHIGMTECSAVTLRKANAVHPVASVEIEVSPFAYEAETQRVIATAAELKIPIFAYSPQAAGFLTGKIRSREDFPANDFRLHFDRFQPENFHHNLQLVDRLTEIGKKRGVTPGQLSIAWVASLGPHMAPLPGSSHPDRTIENFSAGDIVLSENERAEIQKGIDEIPIKGARYFSAAQTLLWG